MKHFLITLLLFFVFSGLMSQNLIGKNVAEVKTTMKGLYPRMNCDATSLKNVHPSIKYSDQDEMKTLMFFFDENNKCKYSKFIIDNSLLTESLDSLNRTYDYKGHLIWEQKLKGKYYKITLQKNEWFFTLIIQNK